MTHPAPREDLHRAVVRAGLSNDPLGHAIEALGELVERVEVAAETAKAPLSEKALAGLVERVSKGVRLVVLRQTGAIVAAACVASAVVAGVGGFYAGQRSVVPDLAWAALIRANPQGVAPVREWTDPAHRVQVGEFRLFLSAPPAVVPSR